MTRRTEAAARALLAAAKPDRADRGRTVLVPRDLVDALRRAIEEQKATQEQNTVTPELQQFLELGAAGANGSFSMVWQQSAQPGACWECGAPGDIHQHHPVPRSRGGMRTIPLCECCHGKAHHRDGAMSTSVLTRDALQAKKARGERTGGIPVGCRVSADGRTLEADPAEREIVAVVSELRAAGLSIRAIAAELARLGYRTRKGGYIAPTQVARLCKSLATVDTTRTES
jgi:5-methylcytosine-specific restriction endonuclease McrA